MNNNQSNSQNNAINNQSNVSLGSWSVLSLFAAYYGFTQDTST